MHALEHKRNIVPVLMEDFTYPSEDKLALLPDAMRVLPNLQAIAYSNVHHESAVRKIAEALSRVREEPPIQAIIEPPVETTAAQTPPLPKPGPQTPPEPPPPSRPNPKLRDTIFAAVKKSGTAGPQSIAVSLYRTHGEPLIPELCAMLVDESVPSFRRGPLYDVLKICSAQPKARTHSSRVFNTMLECVQMGGSDLVKATEVVGTLPISPEEKWRGLFDLFPVVHLSGGVSLLKMLLQIVPPGQRDELCMALTELLPVSDPKLQIAVIDSLRKLAYKAATPAIRDLAQMSLDREVIGSTAECLAAWGDTASAPILRQALTGCTDGWTWRVLAVSLHKLEGPAASRFLVDQFPALTEEIQWEVLRWDDSWDALKAANTRVLSDVLQRLAKCALSDEMKKLATLRISGLSS